MSDGNPTNSFFSEGVIGAAGFILGLLFKVISGVFAAGKRDAELATKSDLVNYVTQDQFTEFKTDIKADLDEIKSTQNRNAQRSDDQHNQLVGLLLSKDLK